MALKLISGSSRRRRIAAQIDVADPATSQPETLGLFFVPSSVLAFAGSLLLNGCALPADTRPLPPAEVVYQAGRPGTPGTPRDGAMAPGQAATKDAVLQNGRVHLGLCLQQALRYNLDASIARLDATEARNRIDVAKAEFDPQMAGTIVNFPDAGGDTTGNGVIQKKFVTGTDIRAEVGTVTFDNTDRTQGQVSNQVDVAVRLRQALLKGGNRSVNESGIRAARIIAKNADATTEAQILEMLRSGESLYWTASFASQLLQSQKQGLERAEKVLELVNSRKEAGASTRIDVLEAEAAVASARDAVGRVQKHYLDTVTLLWQVAGFEIHEPEYDLVFAGLAEAKVSRGKTDPEASYRKAIERSPTAVLLANQVSLKGIGVDRARNNLLPRLDLEFNVGTGDLFSFERVGATTTTSTGATSTTTTTGNWNVLLRFTVPWFSRAERAELQSARAELEKSELVRTQGLRELKRQIYESCREITSERNQLEAASYGMRVNREKWDEQFRRYQEGLVSVRDLLEAEEAFRRSETVELEARLRLILAGILLARQEGTLPERNHFVL
jgi:outer membrane protein TolC